MLLEKRENVNMLSFFYISVPRYQLRIRVGLLAVEIVWWCVIVRHMQLLREPAVPPTEAAVVHRDAKFGLSLKGKKRFNS